MIAVPGASSARAARSSSALKAEWPLAHHRDPAPGVAGAVGAEDVRDPVEDAVGHRPLAGGGQAACAERVGGGVGAGRVDYRPGEHLRLGAARRPHPQHERRPVAALRRALVGAAPGHGHHPGTVADTRAQRRQGRQGLQVPLDQLPPRGQPVRGRRRPTRLGQEGRRGGVDEAAPGGEEADVSPRPDGGAGAVAGLEDERRRPPTEQVGGGGEADRPGADDGDGERLRGRGEHLGGGGVGRGCRHGSAPRASWIEHRRSTASEPTSYIE